MTTKQIEEKLNALEVEQKKYNPKAFGKAKGLISQEIMVLKWVLE